MKCERKDSLSYEPPALSELVQSFVAVRGAGPGPADSPGGEPGPGDGGGDGGIDLPEIPGV